MIYRKEIDGLRTVAVLPVILFHAGVTIFSGGYVGVDIFFVISGYLITTILIGEMGEKNFSIAKFYERRARRILPALFVVILCCVPFAWLWMMPDELQNFAQSIIAVVFFSSNILFWREEGYFAPAAESKPLLHTWSLAVEEQYYVVFPILLLLMWRFGRKNLLATIWAMALVSFASSCWASFASPSANFYLAPTRAWELLAGSICAFHLQDKGPKENNLLSLLGLLLILFAIFFYDDSTPFPGVYALVPILGATAIILYGSSETWVGKFLSNRLFVGIGLISYSAYLWHQPLFAFARIRSVDEPSLAIMLLLAAISMLLAYFSWRYVERPFRKGGNSVLKSRGAVFTASGIACSILLGIGMIGHLGGGFQSRFNEMPLKFILAKKDTSNRSCLFNFNSSEISHPMKSCTNSRDGNVDVLLIGDSHMWSISDEIERELDNEGVKFYLVSHIGCPPFAGLTLFDGKARRNCQKFVKSAFEWAERHNVHTVVLAARFPRYLSGECYNNGEGGIEPGTCSFADVDEFAQNSAHDAARRARVLKAYETNINELAKKFDVVLVYPIPEAGWHVPKYGFKKSMFGSESLDITTSYTAYKQRSKDVRTLFDRLAQSNTKIHAARVEKAFCSEINDRCINADNGGIYYIDENHLSTRGARLASPVINDAILSSLGRANKLPMAAQGH